MFFINFVFLLVLGLIIWPLSDLVICLITKKAFVYSVSEHIVQPTFIAFIIAITADLFGNSKKNKK